MSRALLALLVLTSVLLLGVDVIAPNAAVAATPAPTLPGGDVGPVPRLRVSPSCAELADLPPTPRPTRRPITHVIPLATPTPTPTFYLGEGDFGLVLAEVDAVDELIFDAPGNLELRIRGSGFEPRTRVILEFGIKGKYAWISEARSDRLGTFDVRVDVARPRVRGWYEVRARGEVPLALAIVRLPCDDRQRPTVEVETLCSGSGGSGDQPATLRITGEHWPRSGGPVTLVAYPEDGGESIGLGEANIGADGTFEHDSGRARRLSDGVYQLSARMKRDSDYGARVVFDVTCEQPYVRIVPDCGPAGAPSRRMDLRVRAGGFAPGAEALVIWDFGGSHEAWPARVNDRGRVALTIDPLRRPEGTYQLRVVQDESLPVGLSPDWGTDYISRRIARTSFVAPCPFFEETGKLRLEPTCTRPVLQGDEPRRMEYAVIGSGFRPGPLTVVFDVGGEEEEHEATADATGAFELRFRSHVRPASSVRIAASQEGTVEGSAARFSVTAATRLRAPCEEAAPGPLVIAPTCIAPTFGIASVVSADVHGSAFYPHGNVYLAFEDQSTEQVIRADQDGAFAALVPIDGRGPGEHTLTGVQRDATRQRSVVAEATVVLTVPCELEPWIEIDPASGPAGYTVRVTGGDFPPGSEAILIWDRGIDAGRPVMAEVGDDGSLSVRLLILPNDLTGERTLTVVVADQELLYPEATADYLVVPGTGTPPSAGSDGIIYRH